MIRMCCNQLVAWLNALSFAFAILVVEKEMEPKVSPRVQGVCCMYLYHSLRAPNVKLEVGQRWELCSD